MAIDGIGPGHEHATVSQCKTVGNWDLPQFAAGSLCYFTESYNDATVFIPHEPYSRL